MIATDGTGISRSAMPKKSVSEHRFAIICLDPLSHHDQKFTEGFLPGMDRTEHSLEQHIVGIRLE